MTYKGIIIWLKLLFSVAVIQLRHAEGNNCQPGILYLIKFSYKNGAKDIPIQKKTKTVGD